MALWVSSVSSNSYTDILNPDMQNVTVFGDGFFKEAINLQ